MHNKQYAELHTLKITSQFICVRRRQLGRERGSLSIRGQFHGNAYIYPYAIQINSLILLSSIWIRINYIHRNWISLRVFVCEFAKQMATSRWKEGPVYSVHNTYKEKKICRFTVHVRFNYEIRNLFMNK